METNSSHLSYDPNAAGNPDLGIFGLPYSFDQSKVIFIPVPWEATTSYGSGTSHGPEAILQASAQMDLFDSDVLNPHLAGLHAIDPSPDVFELNRRSKVLAQTIIESYGEIGDSLELKKNRELVNEASREVNRWVESQVNQILEQGKIPALIGGDHSSPFGAFSAASKIYPDFGILHFDAHSDTRKAYLGFEHSHASIMYNASQKIPQISKIIQVGIRDFCEEEFCYTRDHPKFDVFYDSDLSERKLSGEPFSKIADDIIRKLPKQVWISFDIDGLDPKYCPHTGTPVPGGLEFNEALMIIRKLARSGRKIIGFDVVEVSPVLNQDGVPIEVNQANDEWDANVGMRLVYKISALALASQGICDWRK